MTSEQSTDVPNHAPPKHAPSAPMPMWWLLGPVVGALVASVVLVGATVWLAAGEIDRTVIAGSQRLAESAMRTVQREMTLWVKDYAFWGATVQNLVVAPNPDWAADNVGQYIFDTFSTTATVAVDAGGQVIYFAADAKRPSPPAGFTDDLVTAVQSLIDEARAAPYVEPVGVSGLVRVGDVALLASAAAITPERPTGEALLPHPRPVLLFIRELDATMFAALAERFSLPGFRWVPGSEAPSPHACPIADVTGEVIGFVDWVPETPGDALVARIMWPLAALGLILAGFGGLALRRVIKANRDLHEQTHALHQANEQLSANAAGVRSALQRAEHATRAKSSFLAGISPELRTPLTAIIGFSQILKLQHRPGKERSREQEYAEIIHDSSQHLLNLVNDILDLSKIETGGYELEESWVDVGREARVVRSLLAHEAERRGVEVLVDVVGDLPALYADAKSVRQIVINLVSNGLKFTQRGGWVRLAARVDEDGGMVVEVVDNGAGIQAEDQKHIWEAFTRARNPGLAKAEGSGLGLHLVRVLAQLHGAEVGLESQPGQGTRVWVAFGPERVRAILA